MDGFPVREFLFLSIYVATSLCGTSAPVNKFSLKTHTLRKSLIDSHSSDLLSIPISCPMLIEPSFYSMFLYGYHFETGEIF